MHLIYNPPAPITTAPWPLPLRQIHPLLVQLLSVNDIIDVLSARVSDPWKRTHVSLPPDDMLFDAHCTQLDRSIQTELVASISTGTLFAAALKMFPFIIHVLPLTSDSADESAKAGPMALLKEQDVTLHVLFSEMRTCDELNNALELVPEKMQDANAQRLLPESDMGDPLKSRALPLSERVVLHAIMVIQQRSLAATGEFKNLKKAPTADELHLSKIHSL